MFGNPCDIEYLVDLTEPYNIPLLFDAAHALTAKYRDVPIANFGLASVFSFSPTKMVTCLVRHTKVIVPQFRLRSSGHGWKWREQKDIEKIVVGEPVLSYNEDTGVKEYDEVTNVYKSRPTEILKVILSNGNDIELTPNHPMYVINRGWVLAGELKPGDELLQYLYKWLLNRIAAKKQLAGKTYEDQYGKEKSEIRRNRLSKRMTYLHATPGTSHHDVDWGNTLLKHHADNKGKRMSVQACRRMSEKQKERYDRMTPEDWDAFRKRATEVANRPGMRERRSVAMKNKWKDPEYRQRNLERSRQAQMNPEYWVKYAKGLNLRPNRAEMKLQKIINRMCPGEYQYNGDYKLGVTIDRLIPDFVNVNGKKKVIDLLGSHWHKPEEEAQRLERFRKCGFDGLIVWEKELRDVLVLQQKIKTFNYNPNVEIVKVVEITRRRFHQMVYNIETAKNHNYFANGILVHNCGEGGMIVSNDSVLTEKLCQLRNYGQAQDYDCPLPGLNARLSEVHAVLGLESLQRLKQRTKHREELVETYLEELDGLVGTQATMPHSYHACKDFSILLAPKLRQKVEPALKAKDIPYKRYFRPISSLTCYPDLHRGPMAYYVFDRILQLPLHSNLEIQQVRDISRVVSRAIRGKTSAIDARTKPVKVPESPHVLVSSNNAGGA